MNLEQEDRDFELANRAFELMTLTERRRVLWRFSALRFPSVVDRFFSAVEFVISESATKADAVRLSTEDAHRDLER